jgi:flagellar hook-associated protein 1 FlgK
MASDMLSIGSSGLRAAQAQLDVTSQNIANAATAGYTRRSVTQSDLTGVNVNGTYGVISQWGVRVTGITRNVDATSASEVRRTGSDAARADTLVAGLTTVSDAVDNSNVYSSITAFQSALSQLTTNPADSSLRANVLAAAGNMAQSFQTASGALDAAKSNFQLSASNTVGQVNTLAANLAKLNQAIGSTTDPSSQAGLLDQRDTMLQQISQYGNITTTIAANGTVNVQMGGASGPMLVTGTTANTLAMSQDSTGAISYTLNGSALSLSGGSLAGTQQAMASAISAKSSLDSIAASMMSTVNTAQSHGAALNGSQGQPMFSGTGAADMAVSLTSGSGIAAAASGSAPNSSDGSNLQALISSLGSTDIAGQTNTLLYNLSSAVSSNTTTRDTLDTIYANAQATLSNQSGVNSDEEAANLIRYQQAYQASAKVISVAQNLFDQLLQI